MDDPIPKFAKIILFWLLIVWFVTINLFVFIPTYKLLSAYKPYEGQRDNIISPPTPPEPLVFSELNSNLSLKIQTNLIKNSEQKVSTYTQQVSAYSQQISAYKTYIEVEKTNSGITVYQTVVEDTLAILLNTVLLSFLGLVGIKATGTLLTSYLTYKKDQPVKDFKLL